MTTDVLLPLAALGGVIAGLYVYMRRRSAQLYMAAARAEIANLTSETARLEQIIATQSQVVVASADLDSFMQLVAERLLHLTPAYGAASRAPGG